MDLDAGLAEGLQNGVAVAVRLFEEILPGKDVHSVAGKDGGVFVPFAVDGGLAAPYGRAVHQVVVEQGEVVEYFDADGCIACLLYVAPQEVGGGEEQRRAYAFAAQGEGVFDRLVEFGRGAVEVFGSKVFADFCLYFF